MHGLEEFIVTAKFTSYVGDGRFATPCRLDSHDLTFDKDGWSYRDSYFGGTDFLGQETVWKEERAVWVMNYYGHITRSDLIDAQRAGHVIKRALSQLYSQGRFLGGFDCLVGAFEYRDNSSGTFERFQGVERIMREGILVYELWYHGGLVIA